MSRRFGSQIVALAATLAIGSTIFLAGQGKQTRNFRAHLSDEEGLGSRGQGQVILQVSKDGNGVRFKLIVANIENVNMAHIHLLPSPTATAGPPVVWLYPAAPPPVTIEGRFNGVLSEGTFTAANLVGPLSGQDLSQLLEAIEAGLTYVNVHTDENPGGEIRGTLH
jgi:hypothetical protein